MKCKQSKRFGFYSQQLDDYRFLTTHHVWPAPCAKIVARQQRRTDPVDPHNLEKPVCNRPGVVGTYASPNRKTNPTNKTTVRSYRRSVGSPVLWRKPVCLTQQGKAGASFVRSLLWTQIILGKNITARWMQEAEFHKQFALINLQFSLLSIVVQPFSFIMHSAD